MPSLADPAAATLASATSTLQMLSAEAAAINVTLHLRRTSRNYALLDSSLAVQVSYMLHAQYSLFAGVVSVPPRLSP